jgi:hypothetical protein
VVGGEGEDPVVLGVAGDQLGQPEPVGLHEVDRVVGALLDREVVQLEAVGAVGAQHVLLGAVALDQHVARPPAHPGHDQVALLVAAAVGVLERVADDRDQVAGVRAVDLVQIGRHAAVGLVLVAGGLPVLLTGALLVAHRDLAAGLLAVDAGHDQDPVAGLRRVDRLLDVAVAAALQKLQPLLARARRLAPLARPDRLDALRGVALADHTAGALGPPLRHPADAAVGVVGRALGMAGGDGGERERRQQDHEHETGQGRHPSCDHPVNTCAESETGAARRLMLRRR